MTAPAPELTVDFTALIPCAMAPCDTPATWRLTLHHKGTKAPCVSPLFCQDCHDTAVVTLVRLASERAITLCECPHPCYWRWTRL